jgi:hypothetical protein
MKVNYISQMSNYNSNDIEVKKIIQTINAPENKNQDVGHIVHYEVSKQEDNFKKKLEEKRRRKTLLSTSDMMEKVEVVVITIFFKILMNRRIKGFQPTNAI